MVGTFIDFQKVKGFLLPCNYSCSVVFAYAVYPLNRVWLRDFTTQPCLLISSTPLYPAEFFPSELNAE